MKNNIIIALLSIGLFSGCSDFFDQPNLTEKSTENYYSNPTDIDETLIGAYSCLGAEDGRQNATLMANLMGDECFGGGGINDIAAQSADRFENPLEDLYASFYTRNYEGILAINGMLENVHKTDYQGDTVQANYDLGQAYFLRSFFYFRLAKYFGEVPIDLSTELEYLPKSSADEVYAQITSDMKKAIEYLPSDPYTSVSPGRVTKWAAEGMMARIFLFYTGYYNKTELPLVEGGSVSKAQVVTWLEDCIDNSGHVLEEHFESIWPFSALGDEDVAGTGLSLADSDYKYGYGDSIKWAGNGSSETVFTVKYNNQGSYGETGRVSYANQLVLYSGIRSQNIIPFGTGWGVSTVNPQLMDLFDADDPRLYATILNFTGSDVNEPDGYQIGLGSAVDETRLFSKKYSNILTSSGSGIFYEMYGGSNNFQMWNMQDEILMRFSDILLMAAELGSNSQANLDKVRERVGLTSVTYSLDALKDERHREFALEGIRWFDLLRWGDVQSAMEQTNGVSVYNNAVLTTYNINFDIDRVFLPLPESQIRLSQGVLEQNPGWE